MKHGIKNIVLVKNLMYKGCENHYGCILCGEIYPAHCYKREEMAERECKEENRIIWSKKENRTWRVI